MEIESYEPYHIGNKLNPSTNFEGLKNKLREKLKTAGYTVIEKTPSGGQIILDLPTEVLGTKNDVRVELNLLAQALNVVGAKPDSVTEIFTETASILQEAEYELDKLILFYEIFAQIVVKSDDKPIDILNKSVNLDLKNLSIEDIPNLDIIEVRIGGGDTAKGNLFSLLIQPNPTSPSSKFLVRVQYVSKNKEIIESFYRDLETKIIDLINKMVNT